MSTTATELLAPYAAALAGIRERDGGRLTLAEALIRKEAAHVAQVRREASTPVGGWKNGLPLEPATLLGLFIRGARTGDMEHLRTVRANDQDCSRRDIADTLLNAENRYVDHQDCRGMTTDQLIAYSCD